MNKNENNNIAPVLYIPHGGGPLPLLGDISHMSLGKFLSFIPAKIKKPEAILVISAHWEEKIPTIFTGKTSSLFFDYYGFPKEAYTIDYSLQGHVELTSRVSEILYDSGIQTAVNYDRGFDHGVFVPLKLMYPEADIPCIQLSLMHNLSAEEHIKMGQGLREIRKNNILILGSGMSFHNMKSFFSNDPGEYESSVIFDKWLTDLCCYSHKTYDNRRNELINWESAPFARFCHPREEHLLPLHVCFGLAGQKPAELVFHEKLLGRMVSGFLWS